jgi:hypothetical protein
MVKAWLQRLERSAGHSSFRLRDGSLYHYNFDQAGGELFTYLLALWSGKDPPPEEPPIVRALRRAADPISAVGPFRPTNLQAGAFLDPAAIILEDHEVGEPGEVPDLSE